MNSYDKNENVTLQWIASLAFAVVCCAVLFLVFAKYVVDLRGRLDVLQDGQMKILAELQAMHRAIPPLAVLPPPAQPGQGAGAVPGVAPPGAALPEGVQPSAPGAVPEQAPPANAPAPAAGGGEASAPSGLPPINLPTAGAPSVPDVAPAPPVQVPAVPAPAKP